MGSTFIPSRCALIDNVGSNVLIRGNMPLMAPSMRYALQEIGEASGVVDIANRLVVEIPIIDNVGERDQFKEIFNNFRPKCSSITRMCSNTYLPEPDLG